MCRPLKLCPRISDILGYVFPVNKTVPIQNCFRREKKEKRKKRQPLSFCKISITD